MNTMSSYDPIDEALNTTNAIEVSNTPEGGGVRRKDDLKNVCLLYTSDAADE